MTTPIGKALTWDELADLYDEAHPGSARPARTLRMDTVFQWAKEQTEKFSLCPKEGTLHPILGKEVK